MSADASRPLRPGDLVIDDGDGRLGMVIEGPDRHGTIGVMWRGGTPYPVFRHEGHGSLTRASEAAVAAFVASLAAPKAPETESRVDGATEAEANVVTYGACREAVSGRHRITWSKVPGLIHNGEQATPDHWRGYCGYCDETFLE